MRVRRSSSWELVLRCLPVATQKSFFCRDRTSRRIIRDLELLKTLLAIEQVVRRSRYSKRSSEVFDLIMPMTTLSSCARTPGIGAAQICWDGGDLVCCSECPAAYHPECMGVSLQVLPPPPPHPLFPPPSTLASLQPPGQVRIPGVCRLHGEGRSGGGHGGGGGGGGGSWAP